MSHAMYGCSNGYGTYGYSNGYGMYGYSNGYGTHGYISMSHGMYGYDGYASRWRHIAEQLELHHLWRRLEMTDDIR